MRAGDIFDACSTKALYGPTFVGDMGLKKNVYRAFLKLFPEVHPSTLSQETDLDTEQIENILTELKSKFPTSSLSRYNTVTFQGGMGFVLGILGIVGWASFHLFIQGLAKLNVSRFVNSALPSAFWEKSLGGIGISILGLNCCSALNKHGVYPELIAALDRKFIKDMPVQI